jgi:hypothetical protein
MSKLSSKSIVLLAASALLMASTVRAADPAFREHLAAWQGGGVPAERAEPSPRSPSDRPRQPPQAEPLFAAPPVARSDWQEASPPAGGDAYYDPGYEADGSSDCGGGCGPGCCGLGGCGGGCCGFGFPGCGSWGGSPCDPCSGGCPGGCSTLVWARFEALLWWQQGRDLPPLVTTDPATEPFATAGILPNASVLFGNGTEQGDVAVGGRFDIGTWCDTQQCYGFGWRFFGLGNDSMGFASSSVQNPVLAIPFSTINPVANDALVISYPGLREGSINIDLDSEILGNDLYGRFLLCRNGLCRIDFITGYHFSRFADSLVMRSQFTDVDPQSVDFNSVTTVVDEFHANNEFHGGILGFIWERDCGCLNTQLLARTALGGMRQRMLIDGSFTFDTPAAPPVVTPGGLFTAPSNLGTFGQTEFSAVTEFGLTCAYRVRRCTQLTFGYSFILWNNVQRPGNAIDTTIDNGQPSTRPAFNFNTTSFWAQGLNLGFECKF